MLNREDADSTMKLVSNMKFIHTFEAHAFVLVALKALLIYANAFRCILVYSIKEIHTRLNYVRLRICRA